MLPKIAIIYLFFHSEPYLDDVVSALKKVSYPKDRLELVIVDNPHPQSGPSVRAIEETVMPFSGAELPHVTLLPQKENLGFAAGNVFAPLVSVLETDKSIAVAQSSLLLYPDTEYLNNAGNSFHYLGFGFCDEYRSRVAEVKLPRVKEISYASGAAMMIRA